jgi:hypothetical protein
MREILADKELVAYCGLFCGACRRYLGEKCAGCHENTKAGWCKVRGCCLEKKIASCADCGEFKDPRQCKKFDNAFSRLFGIIFRSDRPACIDCIKSIGIGAYASKMAESRLQSIKR